MRQVKAFSIADILAVSATLCGRNLPAFAPFALIAMTPFFIGEQYIAFPDWPEGAEAKLENPWEQVWKPSILFFLLDGICQCWLLTGLTHGVVRSLRGGGAGFGEILSQSLRWFPAALLAGAAATAATLLGLMALIVPGIIISLMLWVAIPALVVERKGILPSLQRSMRLTDGYKGQIFLLQLLLLAGSVILGNLDDSFADALSPALEWGLKSATAWALSAFGAVMTAVVYHDLRILKDGADGASRNNLSPIR